MKKRLVFSFYLDENSFENEVNKIHFNCLKQYMNVFDIISFNIIIDDTDNLLLISKLEKYILSFCSKNEITFTIVKNNEFRESQVFYNEIVQKLDMNNLTFFGHNKGITNVKDHPKDEIYKWITSMYYYNLNYIKEVDDFLVNKKGISYGTFLCKNHELNVYIKYGWCYLGTFFWVNMLSLNNYIKVNNIELPELHERFYDEDFLGNIYDIWPSPFATSHNKMYLVQRLDMYENTNMVLDYFKLKTDEYLEFHNNMINN